MESVLIKHQVKKFGPRPIAGWGDGATITATVRHDDSCSNGHNSFSITAHIWLPRRRDCEACGCLHDEVARVFPELAPLLKWHLCSTDEPMHYVANTIYHASDKDCHGLRKGETRQIRNGKTGQPCWKLTAIATNGEAIPEALPKYVDADEQPYCAARLEYRPWLRIEEGKKPDLDAARRAAIWPEATLEQLQDKDALLARLPALMAEFQKAVESLGLIY